MEFIGRTKELAILDEEYRKQSSFVIIYGRRRVGKTRLIEQFLMDKSNAVYFQATEVINNWNLEQFSHAVCVSLGYPDYAFKGWAEAFDAASAREKVVIAIDEFQYLVQADPSLPSLLQSVWDNVLSRRQVMLVLCGSHLGMMERYTLNHSSPLYGRRTAVIKLSPLSFLEAYGKVSAENVRRYAVTGGVPKYLELFDGLSLEEGISRNILSSSGFLHEEPLFLLGIEVKEPLNYISILRSVASGNRKLSDICGSMEIQNNRLGPYLETLGRMGILERHTPVPIKGNGNLRNGLYTISDNFLRFWFGFVFPYLSELDSGRPARAAEHIRRHLDDSLASFVFEDVCREVASKELTEYSGFGAYWEKDLEIDILAVDEARKRIFAGECKFHQGKVTLSVLEHLRSQCMKIRGTEGYSFEYGLFSVSGFDSGLVKVAEESGVRLFDFSDRPR